MSQGSLHSYTFHKMQQLGKEGKTQINVSVESKFSHNPLFPTATGKLVSWCLLAIRLLVMQLVASTHASSPAGPTWDDARGREKDLLTSQLPEHIVQIYIYTYMYVLHIAEVYSVDIPCNEFLNSVDCNLSQIWQANAIGMQLQPRMTLGKGV